MVSSTRLAGAGVVGVLIWARVNVALAENLNSAMCHVAPTGNDGYLDAYNRRA